jgi:hypothetical protein
MKDQIGWPNVAGVFPSMKKWLYQASPYPKRGAQNNSHHLIAIAAIKNRVAHPVAQKCHLRVDAFEC